jgi:class 3 adenylate cyclase
VRRGSPRTELVAVLFTDIVSSTEIAREVGDRRWAGLVAAHHRIVRAALRRHRGRELDTAGDGFFAVFPRPAEAVRCAVEIADEVRELGLEIRAGMHLGEAEVMGSKVGGLVVNTAARIMSLGGAGEVLVSQTVRDAIAGKGLGFEDRGVHALKGLDGEFRVFSVTEVDGNARPTPLDPADASARRDARAPERGPRRGPRPAIVVGSIAGLLVVVGTMAIAASQRNASPPGTRSPAASGTNGPPPLGSVVGMDPITGEIQETISGLHLEVLNSVHPVMSVGEGGVWVMDAVHVIHVDPEAGTVRKYVDLRGAGFAGPIGRVVAGLGEVWITASGPAYQASGRLARIDVGEDVETRDIVFPHVGYATGLATGADSVWMSFSDGTVLRIDPQTAEVQRTFRLGGSLDSLAFGDGEVWAGDKLSSTLSEIDARTERVSDPITVGGNIDALAVGGRSAWVLDQTAGTVTGVTVANGAGQPIRVGASPTDILGRDDAIYVSDRSGLIYRIDPSIRQAVDPIDVGASVEALAFDPSHNDLWALVADCATNGRGCA